MQEGNQSDNCLGRVSIGARSDQSRFRRHLVGVSVAVEFPCFVAYPEMLVLDGPNTLRGCEDG